MTRRVVTDPLTGKMRTEDDVSDVLKQDIADLRREVRDRIAGNAPFHDDPNTGPPLDDAPAEAGLAGSNGYAQGVLLGDAVRERVTKCTLEMAKERFPEVYGNLSLEALRKGLVWVYQQEGELVIASFAPKGFPPLIGGF